MANDKEVQKVKIVGPLYVFKSWLGIIRDLLLIIFLIAGILGIIVAVFAFQEISQSPVVGALKNGDIGSLVGGNIGEAVANPNQVLDSLNLIEESYLQDPNKALAEVQKLEFLAKSMGAKDQDLAPLSELKKAIQERDDAKFSQLMGEIKSSLQ